MTKTIAFDCVTQTVMPGRILEVKIIVNGNAGDDMWFAYDTKTQGTRIELP